MHTNACSRLASLCQTWAHGHPVLCQILSDTKELQKEINSLSGKLDRTFAVTDELVFKVWVRLGWVEGWGGAGLLPVCLLTGWLGPKPCVSPVGMLLLQPGCVPQRMIRGVGEGGLVGSWRWYVLETWGKPTDPFCLIRMPRRMMPFGRHTSI